jgi:hypothetical protein
MFNALTIYQTNRDLMAMKYESINSATAKLQIIHVLH